MTNAAGKIPETWVQATIGDVCSQPQYGYTTKAAKNGDLRLLRTTDITSGRINWRTVPYCSENPDDPETYLLEDGDIVVSRAGSVGVSHLVTKPRKAVFASYLIRFRPFIDRRFLRYFLGSPDYWVAIADKKLGVAVPNVNATKLKSIPVPVPPAREQTRIVTKIEELFSDLDQGVESLKTARAQLNVYRQAVLKHAFEGKLTAQWREENKDKLETPEQLLARIKQERAVRYEQQLKEWKAAVKKWEQAGRSGKQPARPRKPAELPQLGSGELAKLPPSPEGHVYTYLANLGELGRGKSKHRPRNAPELFGGPYPFIQTGEIKAAGRIIREHSQAYSELGLEQSKLWPEGTLCITIAANIAETAFLGFNGCFPDSVVGFTATKTLVLPDYVELFIKSVRTRIEAYAPATAQKNINLTTLEFLVVPLCSLQEQRVLVDQLEAVLSVIEEQSGAIGNQLLKTDALRQSVLKKAFAGQLVAQDPNDEPASVLLERIKAEKETAETNSKITKKTTTRKTTRKRTAA